MLVCPHSIQDHVNGTVLAPRAWLGLHLPHAWDIPKATRMTMILASGSPFRAEILRNAGLDFDAVSSDIDERAVEAPMLESNVIPADIASVLAEAKAIDVSTRHPGALVLGADQTLGFEGESLHKCATMEEARIRLLRLSGKTHDLNSALTLVRDGETLWRHVSVAHMHMRLLSPLFIGRYLATAGADVLASVGVYHIEALGIQLFERIDGDHYAIIGLPLLPLLDQLRKMDMLDE